MTLRGLPVTLAICPAVMSFPAAARPDACPAFKPGQSVGTVASNSVVEASGLAASRDNPDVLWANNDSGDSARLFAMSTAGAHLGIYNISGATAIDWEDLAIGPGPVAGVDYLYIGDTGDNFNLRSTIKVYRVPEPVVNAQQSPVTVTLRGAQTITLAYPDGPRDAETLMVDVNGDIYIVSKRVTAHGRVYRAAYPQATSGTVTMEFVTELPWGSADGSGGATGGDIAADGSAIIVRRYTNQSPQATIWLRPPGMSIGQAIAGAGCNVTLLAEPQGEAVAFRPGSLGYYTLSEGSHPTINLFSQVLVADVTQDGAINIDDLLAVINAWGSCQPKPPCPADIVVDQAVNIDDLLAVISSWTSP